MEAIGEILQRLGKGAASKIAATATPTPGSSSESRDGYPRGEPDPPKACICRGRSWYRYDVPIDHPWFGKAYPCICKIMEARGRRREWLWSVSGLSPLLRGKTLSSFDSDRQFTAFQATALFASGQAPQPWLLVQGSTGTGKTHLAAAAVNALVGQGINAVYAYVPDMLESLRFGYQDGTFRDQWQFFRTCQALILDDILEHQTDWVKEQLTSLLDYRLREMGPTMIGMNLDLGEMPARIRSRLSDSLVCKVVIMDGTDYRVEGRGLAAAID